MKLKKIIIIFLTMALICGFSLSVSFAENPAFSYAVTDGETSNNAHLPRTNGYRGSPLYSYLTWDGNDLMRVEYRGEYILAETYDSSFNIKKRVEIETELEHFGGFYSGADAYYLAFGSDNTCECNNEVFRFVKYDKNWNRLCARSIYGANTTVPFEAGGLAMTEHDGVLYIHTCHKMFKSEDGLNHQANCSFKLKESDMSILSGFAGVMDLSSGYVSHSFQQKVAVDEKYLYRSDLGDAYPRGITLTATGHDDNIADPTVYRAVVLIPGETGDNYTGFSLGGIEVSDDFAVVAGCGVTEDDPARNVFISATSKSDWSYSTSWLTSYNEDSLIDIGSPKLVKLNANQFLLMWEEYNRSEALYSTKVVRLGHDGSPETAIYTLPVALSGCEPIVDGNGYVIWYYTQYSSPKFLMLDPSRLEAAEQQTGGIKEIGLCDVELGYYECEYSGETFTPNVYASLNGRSLKEGVDFTVAYKNNKEPGVATATVTGKGDYSGSVELSFTINKMSQQIDLSFVEGKVALGETRKAEASAKGAITFSSENESVATVDADGTIHGISAGEATIIVTAAETEYYAQKSAKMAITVEKDEMNVAQSEIEVYLDYYDSLYTGKEIRPEITVVHFGRTLTEGKDYELSFENNINAGVASVTIKGIGQYTGLAIETYEIEKAYQNIDYDAPADKVELGAAFDLNAHSKSGAAITYESSDPGILTVDGNGRVTAVGEGQTHVLIKAAATDNYLQGEEWVWIDVSKDVHTMEEIDVKYANGSDNISTVTCKCKICGKVEDKQISTITDIAYVFFWTGSTGYSYVSSYACPGDEYQVTLGYYSPENADDTTVVIESSDNNIMTVEGDTIKFVGLGKVTMSIYPKYNPSVKYTREFIVESEHREDPDDPGTDPDDPWYDPDDPWYDPDDDYDDYLEEGMVVEVNGSTYKVLDGWDQTVALTKAKNRKSYIVPSSVTIGDYGTFVVEQIDAGAFTGKSIRTVTIGKNVRKISKYAFKSSKATKMIVKTKLLSKARVKGCLKSSKIKTVQVKVGTKKSTNKKYIKKYKKYFTKANAGKKVNVK